MRGKGCEVRGARCEVRGARCEVRGARCEALWNAFCCDFFLAFSVVDIPVLSRGVQQSMFYYFTISCRRFVPLTPCERTFLHWAQLGLGTGRLPPSGRCHWSLESMRSLLFRITSSLSSFHRFRFAVCALRAYLLVTTACHDQKDSQDELHV